VKLIKLTKSRLLWAVTIAALHHLTVTMAEPNFVTKESSASRISCDGSVEEEIVDLDYLQGRLKKTKAIGPLTKLKLKGEINNLLGKFESFHAGKNDLDIDQLNERFDLLYMKIVSLIQGKDPDLHRQLCNSWDPLSRSLQFSDFFSNA
jgi:hypothetical protein